MGLTLGDVLALDAVRRAAPELMHGHHLLERPVRWVHTSELAEAAFLMRGGELLLTTGLGVSGRGAVGETAYIEALARRGVTALALELGWTFAEAPPALVAAARRVDLPLLVLREVVPFVEITEQVQTALLARSTALGDRTRGLRERLSDALLDGAGPTELTAELSAHLGAPVVLTAADGATAASAGLPPGRRPRSVCRQEITLLDRHWGRLAVLLPARGDDPAVLAASAAAANALELALLRSATSDDLAARRRWLIDDLVHDRFRSPEELVGRCRVLGLPFTQNGTYVTLVVRGVNVDDQPLALRAVESALAPTAALVADLGTDIMAVAATAEAGERLATTVLAALDSPHGTAAARVVHGPPAAGLTQVGRAVSATLRAAELADQLNMPHRCLAAASLTAQVLLAELVGRPSASQLVRGELGPLLEHDRRRGTALVETLRAYLAHGSSKVDAAAALHIRRQTMHQRLSRITALIGDVRDPHRHTGLVLALALATLDGNGSRSADRETASRPAG